MSRKKNEVWAIVARLRPDLKAPVTRISKAKRWSINDFIEEAIIVAIEEYESKRID